MTHTSDKHVTDEELELVTRGKADGIYMKAPNGSPTSLNERQWVQVRTRAFKNWFGDWENVPEAASRIVDENGEPLVEHLCAETRLLPRGDGRGTGSLIYPKRLRSTHSRAVNIPA